jgi:hypothetical protein
MSARETLPPFSDSSAECPKCRYPIVKITWHSRGGALGGHKGFPCEHRRLPGEHICRTCARCGYGFIEATADVGADEKPQHLRGLVPPRDRQER